MSRRNLTIIFQLRIIEKRLVLVDYRTSFCTLVKDLRQKRFTEETNLQKALRVMKEREIATLSQLSVAECITKLSEKTLKMLQH